MFDDISQNQKKSAPPKNIPQNEENDHQNSQEIEDIFSETDNSKKQEINAHKKEVEHDFGIDSLEIQAQNKRKLMVLGFMFIGLFLIAWGTYYGFSKLVKKMSNFENIETPTVIKEKASEVKNIIEEVKEIEEPLSDMEPEEKEEEKKDTDRDRLDDEEEIFLGTNINSADTDSDGLFDYEEVKIYKTDPLVADTDKDGFFDGEEVKAGYNPLGAGKILKINRSQN